MSIGKDVIEKRKEKRRLEAERFKKMSDEFNKKREEAEKIEKEKMDKILVKVDELKSAHARRQLYEYFKTDFTETEFEDLLFMMKNRGLIKVETGHDGFGINHSHSQPIAYVMSVEKK